MSLSAACAVSAATSSFKGAALSGIKTNWHVHTETPWQWVNLTEMVPMNANSFQMCPNSWNIKKSKATQNFLFNCSTNISQDIFCSLKSKAYCKPQPQSKCINDTLTPTCCFTEIQQGLTWDSACVQSIDDHTGHVEIIGWHISANTDEFSVKTEYPWIFVTCANFDQEPLWGRAAEPKWYWLIIIERNNMMPNTAISPILLPWGSSYIYVWFRLRNGKTTVATVTSAQ